MLETFGGKEIRCQLCPEVLNNGVLSFKIMYQPSMFIIRQRTPGTVSRTLADLLLIMAIATFSSLSNLCTPDCSIKMIFFLQ